MKHLRVFTSHNNIHTVVLEKLKKSVSSDCYKLVTANNIEEIIEDIKFKPFFSKKYVLEIVMKGITRDHIFKILKIEWVQCVFICTSLFDFRVLEFIGDDLIKLSNNFPPKEMFLEYVKTRLKKPSEDACLELWKRLKNDMQHLEYFLDELSVEDKITKEVVVKKVPKQSRLSLESFFIAIIMGTNKRDIFSLLENYRYGSHFIKEFLEERMKFLIDLSKEVYTGSLNKSTVKEWVKTDKKFKLTEFKANTYLEVLESHSLDELILLQEKIMKCPNTRYDVFKLVFELFYRKEIS